jgi:CRP-like cAMP-binding protein
MNERDNTAAGSHRIQEYAAGTIIVSEGDKKEGLYVILDGSVEIFQNKRSIRVLQDGDVFGLESIFLQKCCTVTVKALSPSRIAVYQKNVLEEIISENSQVATQIIKSLVAQLEQTTQAAAEHIPLGGFVDFHERIFQDGEVIIEEGTSGKEIYQLVESEKGLKVSIKGKEVARMTQPGEYFGEMSSLLNQTRTATVTSLGRSVVQVFPGEDLESTLLHYPRLSKQIIDTLASRLAKASERIVRKD